MKYTPPKRAIAPFNRLDLGKGITKTPEGTAPRLDCPMWTEGQCLAARMVADELLAGSVVESQAGYVAFIARVTTQHSYTGQEFHGLGTASQMYRNQLTNVRLRLAIKNLLTLEIEDIYSIMGGPELFGALGR